MLWSLGGKFIVVWKINLNLFYPVAAHIKALLEDSDTEAIREDNEATPDRSTAPCPDNLKPHAPVKTRKFCVPSARFREASRARKRLDFTQTSLQPQSFSLINLHQHVFGKSPTVSHGAEPDCLALMRLCASQGSSFVSYIDRHASPFSRVQKMWWNLFAKVYGALSFPRNWLRTKSNLTLKSI